MEFYPRKKEKLKLLGWVLCKTLYIGILTANPYHHSSDLREAVSSFNGGNARFAR